MKTNLSPRTTLIFGGSFDPLHIGHMALVSYILYSYPEVEQIWLTPTAQNPLKPHKTQLPFAQRAAMIMETIAGDERLYCCTQESLLPQPHYTIDLLERLCVMYPERHFGLLIGADNWAVFSRWHRAEDILQRYPLWVYPRPGFTLPEEGESATQQPLFLHQAPRIEISSSEIRKARSEGKDLRYWLPKPEFFDQL